MQTKLSFDALEIKLADYGLDKNGWRMKKYMKGDRPEYHLYYQSYEKVKGSLKDLSNYIDGLIEGLNLKAQGYNLPNNSKILPTYVEFTINKVAKDNSMSFGSKYYCYIHKRTNKESAFYMNVDISTFLVADKQNKKEISLLEIPINPKYMDSKKSINLASYLLYCIDLRLYHWYLIHGRTEYYKYIARVASDSKDFYMHLENTFLGCETEECFIDAVKVRGEV